MNLVSKILLHSVAIVFIAGTVLAVEKKEARVTQVIRDVKLMPSEASARPAVVNEKVSEDTAVRTGDESRSELTFADLTLTRLGENTVFSFNHAGRNARLDSGSILLRVPKNSGGGGIHTRAVTVGITGTTVIFESTRAGRSKLIVLEGGARLTLVKHPKESALVRAGQMLEVPAGADTLPKPTNIDLDRVMKTSPLVKGFPPLPSQDLIVAAIEDQQNSGPGGAPVYQGVAVDDPATGYPGSPPFYPGGSWGGRPKGPRDGGKPPGNGGAPTDGQSNPKGPRGEAGPVGGAGTVKDQPRGSSEPPPPVILRGTGQGKAGGLRGTQATTTHANVPRNSPPPRRKIFKKDQPQIR